MARKLEVSVVSTVVGARRDALERFLELRGGAAVPAVALDWSGGCTDDGPTATPTPMPPRARMMLAGDEEERVVREGRRGLESR